MFKFNVRWYDELSAKEVTDVGYVMGDNYVDSVKTLIDEGYEEEDIIDLRLERINDSTEIVYLPKTVNIEAIDEENIY